MRKISIITAAFRKQHMDRVWKSITSQTYTDWEWVIVNDGQKEIREWYKESVEKDKFINHDVWFVDVPTCKGHYGLYVRNIGIMCSTHDDVCFLDDDNQWEPDHLESLVELAEETGKIPFCWMHIKGKKPGSTFERIKKTGFQKQGIDLGCILYPKRLFYLHGFFKPDAQVTFDWNCIKRIHDGVGGREKFVCTKKPSLIFWHKRY